jgi:hypothetical protein
MSKVEAIWEWRKPSTSWLKGITGILEGNVYGR